MPPAPCPQVLPHHIGHWLRDNLVNELGFYPYPPARHDRVRLEFKVRALRAAMSRVAEDSWTLRVRLAEAMSKHSLAWASITQFRGQGAVPTDDDDDEEMEELVERMAELALE